MATPDIYNYEPSSPVPEFLNKKTTEFYWHGRVVDMVEAALINLPKMLMIANEEGEHQEVMSKLGKTVISLQNQMIPLEAKIGILVSASFKQHLEVLKNVL